MTSYTKPHLSYQEKIIDIYHFDKELRLITFSAIEKVEIFLRASIAYNFSKKQMCFYYKWEEMEVWK